MFNNIFKIVSLWISATIYNIQPLPRRLAEFFGLKARKYIRYGLDSEKQPTLKETLVMGREASGLVYSGRFTGGATGADALVFTDRFNPLGLTVTSTKGLATGSYVLDLLGFPENLTGLVGTCVISDASDPDFDLWANTAAVHVISARAAVSVNTTLGINIFCFEINSPGVDGDALPPGESYTYDLQVFLQ